MTSGNCKQRVYSGQRYDITGHQCGKLAVEGMDGYCRIHYPPHVKAKREADTARWKAESDKRQCDRKAKQDERAEEFRKINAHDDLLAALKWCVNHHGECLGDYEALLSAARAAIAKAEGR